MNQPVQVQHDDRFVVTVYELWRYPDGWQSNDVYRRASFTAPAHASDRAVVRRALAAVGLGGCGLRRDDWTVSDVASLRRGFVGVAIDLDDA